MGFWKHWGTVCLDGILVVGCQDLDRPVSSLSWAGGVRQSWPDGVCKNVLVILKFHLKQYGLLSFFRTVLGEELPRSGSS